MRVWSRPRIAFPSIAILVGCLYTGCSYPGGTSSIMTGGPDRLARGMTVERTIHVGFSSDIRSMVGKKVHVTVDGEPGFTVEPSAFDVFLDASERAMKTIAISAAGNVASDEYRFLINASPEGSYGGSLEFTLSVD